MESPILVGQLLEPVHTRRQLSSSPNQDAPPPSPSQAPNSPDDTNSNSLFGGNSPWSGSQASLTLAPINPNSRPFDNLPLPTWSQNLNPFANLSRDEQDDIVPPPSNQAARAQRIRSQYRIDSESPDPFDFLDLPDSPPAEEEPLMPPKRRSAAIDLTSSSPPPASKKRKASSPGRGRASKAARPRSSSSASAAATPVDLVDLSNVEDTAAYEAQSAQTQAEVIRVQNAAEARKPIRLAEFQCIICMDNPTDLTVTHCGHLFCSECLHQALHAGDKKCCPVCRTNIQPPRNGKQGKQGVFALEMKLLTSKKKGKQAVR